jgi:hypothetical protein
MGSDSRRLLDNQVERTLHVTIICNNLKYFPDGARGGAVVEALSYKPEGRGIDSQWCNGIFHWHNPSGYYGPGVNSDSNINEYQEYLLGVKAAGALGWKPCHLHVPIVLKSGSLILLEPLGPVKAVMGLFLLSWQLTDKSEDTSQKVKVLYLLS